MTFALSAPAKDQSASPKGHLHKTSLGPAPLGGSSGERGDGVAVDAAGNVYVTGYTGSTEASFPLTMGPDFTYNGTVDTFVAKIGDSSASGYNLIVEVTGDGTVASDDDGIDSGAVPAPAPVCATSR